MKRVLVNFIRLFQATRILRAPACRFYPSCSDYAIDAVNKYGIMFGSVLAFMRVCRCHPLHPGGIDYVPNSFPPLRLRQRDTTINPQV